MEGTKKEAKPSKDLEGGDHTSTEPDGPSDVEGESSAHPKDFPSSDEASKCAVDKANSQSGDDDTTSPSPGKRPVEGYAFDKAPPPIKTRREGAASSHASSPPELSPPPSPKRMRELERKEGVFRAIVPPKQGLQQNL